ncbi:MAG: hypothetical protein IT165_17360 [Bryobacterales bacterium]|nr:hypothetical protein [Bryobacterales bacterium]
MGFDPRLALTAMLTVLWSGLSATAAGLNSLYEFRIAECSIKMRIMFPPSYEGKRLEVHRSSNPGKAVCVARQTDSQAGTQTGTQTGTQKCVERFVGAIAVVEFAVTRLVNGKPAAGSIREVVTVVDQSPGMPTRPPFEMSVKLIEGLGSDLQAYGYDEDPLPPSERAAEREMAKQTWRRYRQELFLNDDQRPFAVVQWMHTTSAIRVVGVEDPAGSLTYRNPPTP